MELIDYTGKLNNHNKYLKVINKLEDKTEYIEIVLIDESEDNELIDQIKDDIISTKKVSKWWGTKTFAKNNLYKIKTSKKLFYLLKKYETFCKYFESDNGDYAETTDFGFDDIAFYDKDGNFLLYTTTHEGYITVSDKLIK